MAARRSRRLEGPPVGVYVHIPFCRSKCPYCAFTSVVADDALISAYLEALHAELSRAAEWLRERGSSVPTLYFGGGTPTRLAPQDLSVLVGKALTELPATGDVEVSVEANPGTVDEAYLVQLRQAGVNRLSLGAQAFDDEVLRTLGRIHTASEALAAISAARRAGFDRISLDLMYAVPAQTLDSWAESLRTAVGLAVRHVSCYSLTYEEGTALAQAAADGHLSCADEELELRMFWLAEEVLDQAGLRRYEVSNFAVPGEECRHNLIYWRGGEYLGLGASAHSLAEGERRANVADPAEYVGAMRRGEAVAFRERPTVRQRLAERMMLGLRLAEGVAVHSLAEELPEDARCGFAAGVRELAELGLLEDRNGRIRLSRAGLPVADSVVETFF